MASSSTADQQHSGGGKASTLSCAECRRSKLRCNRVFPCDSCVKRGIAALCPDATIVDTKGNIRQLMSQTQKLQEELRTALDRIRLLEDALQAAQSEISPEPHPLLVKDKAATQLSTTVRLDETETLIERVGSLIINSDGAVKYFGDTASTEYLQHLLPKEEPPKEVVYSDRSFGVTPDLLYIAKAFPLGHLGPFDLAVKSSFLQYLPPRQEAERLIDLYFEHATWMYSCISREELMDKIVKPLYSSVIEIPNVHAIHSHALGVFLFVLAFGTYLDPLRQGASDADDPFDVALQYLALGKAALVINGLNKEVTVASVQALFLVTYFSQLSMQSKSEYRWLLTGITSRLAQSIGLHKDSSKWNLPPDEVQRRRRVMWELCTYDQWTAQTRGRPPAMMVSHMSCGFPEDVEPLIDADGSVSQGYHSYKAGYCHHILSRITHYVFSRGASSYSALMELDKAIRKYPTPKALQMPSVNGNDPMSRTWPKDCKLALQQYTLSIQKESNLLYLHRSYFLLALRLATNDSSKDPLRNQFSPSVLAGYRSACLIVSGLRSLWMAHPKQVEKLWFLWSGMYSSILILSALVIDCPGCSLSPSALVELDHAVSAFERGSAGCRPETTKDVAKRLQEQAHSSFAQHHAAIVQGDPGSIPPNKETLEEILVLGGVTRLVRSDTSNNTYVAPTASSSQTGSPDAVPLAASFPHIPSSAFDVSRNLGSYDAAMDLAMATSDNWWQQDPQPAGMNGSVNGMNNGVPVNGSPAASSYSTGSSTGYSDPQNRDDIWAEYMEWLGVSHGRQEDIGADNYVSPPESNQLTTM